jgi:uncharacterized protein
MAKRHFVSRIDVFALISILLLLSPYVMADVNALFRATEAGDVEKVQSLLDSGVDINERNKFGSFAINSAAVKNNMTLLRLFIEKGADVNVQNWSGDTALICATKYAGGQKETVKLLLEAGANVELQDEDGKTALDYAKEKGHLDAVALLE